jgi:hypothetical protein
MSLYNSTSTSVDADDLGLNPTTPFDSTLLSPFNHSQTLSNSASPSYNINSTSGESLSEYSNYQPSELSEIEIDDEFFGVNFDAGVQRTDSNSSALLGYQPVGLNHPSSQLPTHLEEDLSSAVPASTYPLSPKLTSIPNTPSPRSEAHESKSKSTVSQHEPNNGIHNLQFQPFTPLATDNPTTIQLTPDHSGSSRGSAEKGELSNMARLDYAAQGSQWANHRMQPPTNAFIQSGSQYGNSSIAEPHVNQSSPSRGQGVEVAGRRDDEGVWKSSEKTGQAGLDPENRKRIADMEVPNLKEQAEQRRIDSRNMEVQEWRSQAGGSSDAEDENPDQSYFHFNSESWRRHAGSNNQGIDPEEGNDIAPVDDAASIRENKFVEGQVYFNFKHTEPNEADVELMRQPRQWNDAPSYPYVTATNFQPSTANEAISRWKATADTMSIASRAATWGTRRRSEPSLADMESIADGSFLKKLSISKSKEGDRHRSNSIFDQGLDRLANIVRNRSGSNLHKRGRSSQNAAEPRHNSAGTLAPPLHRASTPGRRSTPSINTAFAAMTGPLAAVGTTHTRGGSVSIAQTSPKSPTHLGFARSVIQRARSRSELSQQEKTAQSSIVGLWRGQGGPPVPNLASPPLEVEQKPRHTEVHDQDEEDDDEDDQVDESDMKMESGQHSEPIVPNYEGFKTHVRRLNPDMDPRCNWLVSRIAHQQEIRYKNLLDLRVKHSQAIMTRTCSAGRLCMSLGGSATLLDAKGNPRESERGTPGLQLVTDFSDDSNPGEGALTDETFPPGVPMPPSRNLPAEFECQLCFKAKKFQKPSDWTKHVHEDVQPFTCTYDKCKEPKSFKRKADWVRHENERHRHLEWWICQVDDCRHPCYRKDNFLQHLVREHKLPEPKQKTKAAIKKARLTEPAWIMLEQCHHETQNKPQDEPCKFCGKSFNTWKKLTVHLAKHMEHISLPVLRLVEARNVDANTIISPVEQILTPVTPIGRAKMESASPFNMDSISPHVPMVPHFSSTYDQPAYYSTTTPSSTYGMQATMPQDVSYDQNSMYQNAYGVQQIDPQRGFGTLDSGGLHMNQGRGFAMMDPGFSHTKVEQSQDFGAVDPGFSHTAPQHSYNTHQASGYSIPQTYSSAAPAVSGYQAPNMLGISDPTYGFDPIAISGSHGFQQVPMSRAQGSASPYGHSPQNVPQNVPYYGHHS